MKFIKPIKSYGNVEILKNSDPQIWTRVPDGENTIVIHVFGMTEEQSEIVSEVIKKELEVLKR